MSGQTLHLQKLESLGYVFAADGGSLYLKSLKVCVQKVLKSIFTNFHTFSSEKLNFAPGKAQVVIQRHPRLSSLIPIERPYATSISVL